jgi:NAD(P)H dehydrogenase (quinone)
MIIGITGGSGRVGRYAIDAAMEHVAPEQVVVTTRTPRALADLADRGVQVRYGDFDRPDSLKDAFRGVDRLLIISASNATGLRHNEHSSAVSAARSVGVTRVAFTSMPNVDKAGHPSGLAAQEYRDGELAVIGSGLDYALLRVAPYTELNAIERMVVPARTGALRLNTGDGRAAFISRSDVGASAVAALVSDEYSSSLVDITGAVARTFGDVAAVVGELLGRTIRYEVIGDEEYKAELLAAGDSPLLADAVSGLGKAIRTGYFDVVTDDATRLLNRAPDTLEQVVERNADVLRAAAHG